MSLFCGRKKTMLSIAVSSAFASGVAAALLMAIPAAANSIDWSGSSNQTESTNYNSWQPAKTDTLSLPSLRGQGLSFAEQYQNKLLGEWSLRNVNGSIKMEHDHDPWIQETLKDMTWRLNAQARQQALMGLVIIDSPSINAFAAPGGVIGINTGTILAAKSMDELASVIAHEVAHLSQHHYESGVDDSKKALLMQVGGMLAAIAASAVDGDAAAAVMMGSQTATMNSSMAFSRSNEREADRIGMQIMTHAGYDPRAMPRFFATMNQQSQLNQSENQFLPSFILSHPLTNERLSDSQSRAQSYPSLSLSQQQRHQALFDLLYWRVQSMGKHASKTTLTTAANNSVGAKLALMNWYGEQQRFKDAEKVLSEINALPVEQRQRLEPLLSITHSQVLTEQDKWSEAAEILDGQHRLYPERRDLRIYLAEALTNSNQPAKAQALLKPLIEQQPSDRYAWQSLQLANEKLAKTTTSPQLANIATINALRYRSQDQLWSNRYESALISLTQAKQLAEKLQNTTQANSARPLLANINAEIKAVKTAKDFKP
ncbi:M48 family metalloprotease [Psychrobacter sp.]